jgi:phosphatidylserine/phosphatidylglycerophosphate/cardiolipin synthase-like enzyme
LIRKDDVPASALIAIKVGRHTAERDIMRMLFTVSLLALCLVAGIKPTSARSAMLVQVCFSPAGECASHLLHALAGADREILVAMYAFTSAILARALIRARERGVDVRVILDADFDRASRSSVAGLLALNGVRVAKVSGASRLNRDPGLMHQKFAVVDQATVASGSYNWTHSADAFNYESLLIFRDAAELAHEFRAEFMRLWGKSQR